MWLLLPRLYQDDPEIVLRMREFLQLITEPDNLAAEARDRLRTIEEIVGPCPYSNALTLINVTCRRSPLLVQRDPQPPSVNAARRSRIDHFQHSHPRIALHPRSCHRLVPGLVQLAQPAHGSALHRSEGAPL